MVNDTKRAAAFLSSLPTEKRELPEEIRGTVIQADKKIEVTIKWGNLTIGKIEKKCCFFCILKAKLDTSTLGLLRLHRSKTQKGSSKVQEKACDM